MESMDIVEPERNFPQFPIRLDVNIEISIRFFPPPRKDRGDFSLFSSSFFAFFISIRIRLSSVNHRRIKRFRSIFLSICLGVDAQWTRSARGQTCAFAIRAFDCFSMLFAPLLFSHSIERERIEANERNLTKMAILDQSYRVVRIHTIFCIQ